MADEKPVCQTIMEDMFARCRKGKGTISNFLARTWLTVQKDSALREPETRATSFTLARNRINCIHANVKLYQLPEAGLAMCGTFRSENALWRKTRVDSWAKTTFFNTS
ncbi:MAG: hypothetical protein OXD29_08775 [Roseovarius sp.]|nr:hypothetical protein [Roseovarius sp.]